jgi:steroid 5-alpha reductase family enzyme
VSTPSATPNPRPGCCATVQAGLFRFSRHPNYFFEIAQWWLIAGFGAVAAGTVLQPGSLGALLLTLLFLGSIALTESISLERHAGYAAYRRRVWPLVPWKPKRAPATAPA